MPPDERAAVKGTERCATHPSRQTVAACALCGRPLCVDCAVPVRGQVLGTECLAEVLGEATMSATEPARRWGRRTARPALDRACGVLLSVATLATFLPWTRFSTGSGFAGAWAIDRRWSMIAAVSAVAALVIWAVFGGRPAIARAAAIAGGAVVALGSLMAILNPPPFTKPALAPWIALASGVAAASCASLAGRKPEVPRV